MISRAAFRLLKICNSPNQFLMKGELCGIEFAKIQRNYWTDMANYELLAPNFSLNSTMDCQLNYNYNFLNFQNYQL